MQVISTPPLYPQSLTFSPFPPLLLFPFYEMLFLFLRTFCWIFNIQMPFEHRTKEFINESIFWWKKFPMKSKTFPLPSREIQTYRCKNKENLYTRGRYTTAYAVVNQLFDKFDVLFSFFPQLSFKLIESCTSDSAPSPVHSCVIRLHFNLRLFYADSELASFVLVLLLMLLLLLLLMLPETCLRL